MKAKARGKAQNCRSGAEIALTALPEPMGLRERAECFIAHRTIYERKVVVQETSQGENNK